MKGKRTIAPLDATGLLDYLETASDRSVGQIQLNKLGEAANLRDRIFAEITEWVHLSAEVLYTDWVLRQRAEARADAAAPADEAA